MVLSPAIVVIGKKKCTGCMACIDYCPHLGLDLSIDNEGFYYPKKNEKCIDCGLCQDICPVINTNNKNHVIGFYSGWTKNRDYHYFSSSGGIFPELASQILDENGVVYGVEYDDNLFTRHVKIEKKEDIKRIMKSKYIQSRMTNIYNDISKALKKEQKVLFSGTPCQTSALKNFHNDENLYTVDIVCHGVPSLKIYEKYKKYLERNKQNKLINIDFRNKRKGWKNFFIKLEFDQNIEYNSHRKDPFYRGYLKNYYLRPACYDCKFCSLPRFGDISLGDFWGVPKQYYNKNGVSIIITNNKKGEFLIGKLNHNGSISIVPVDQSIPIKNNPRINDGKFFIPNQREEIMRNLDKSFEFLDKKYKFTPSLLSYYLNIFLSMVQGVLKK